ncbi:perlucin-like protein [Saccostrea cucullata]|uniref:perlucin-like protein n=1 Tax=Saccostrea cuccullata TaxID=36930 RepID=UPI002ED5FCC0
MRAPKLNTLMLIIVANHVIITSPVVSTNRVLLAIGLAGASLYSSRILDYYWSPEDLGLLTFIIVLLLLPAKQNICDPGWKYFRGHCYIRVEGLFNQPTAQAACNAEGAYLTEITDAEENQFILENILNTVSCSNIYDCTTWIGGNDKATNGVYIWETSGLPVTYTNWIPGNPNNEVIKDCMDIFYTGLWNDRPCTRQEGYICEKNL